MLVTAKSSVMGCENTFVHMFTGTEPVACSEESCARMRSWMCDDCSSRGTIGGVFGQVSGGVAPAASVSFSGEGASLRDVSTALDDCHVELARGRMSCVYA